MRYLITGTVNESAFDSDMPRDETVNALQRGFIPTLKSLLEHQEQGKVLGGGVIPLRTVVLILELPGTSLTAFRPFLLSLAAYDLFDWDVQPLESFEELLGFLDPSE